VADGDNNMIQRFVPSLPRHVRLVCGFFRAGVDQGLYHKFNGYLRIDRGMRQMAPTEPRFRQPWLQAVRRVENIDMVHPSETGDCFSLFPLLEEILLPLKAMILPLAPSFNDASDRSLHTFERETQNEAKAHQMSLRLMNTQYAGLKNAFARGVRITLVRELQVDASTTFQSRCTISRDGLGPSQVARTTLT